MNKRIRKEVENHLRNYKNLDSADPWHNVIESVINKYQDTEKGKLIDLRYQKRRREVQICMELHISQRLYYDWINDILQDVALMAAYEKLIKP
jgi:hypothetical protein